MFMIAVILCFKVADRNGENVYTDIYISGSQSSVNAWPNVTIAPFIRGKIRRVLNKMRTGPFIRACLI